MCTKYISHYGHHKLSCCPCHNSCLFLLLLHSCLKHKSAAPLSLPPARRGLLPFFYRGRRHRGGRGGILLRGGRGLFMGSGVGRRHRVLSVEPAPGGVVAHHLQSRPVVIVRFEREDLHLVRFAGVVWAQSYYWLLVVRSSPLQSR